MTAASETRPRAYIRVEGVSKAFAGNLVLNKATLSLERGEVHALLGANGSGKSTLIKVLTGYHTPEPGAQAWVGGVASKFTRHGLSPESGAPFIMRTLHQDLGLIGHLSVADNTGMVTGYAHGRAGRIRWREQENRTKDLLSIVGQTDIDVRKPVGLCDPLERTQVALARALAGWDTAEGLLILDEPTATLPEDQVQRLFEIIRSISDRGISVLYVSHRLGEIFAVAHRVTALREGEVVGTSDVGSLDRKSIVDLMMGSASAVADHRSDEAAVTEQQSVAMSVTGLGSRTVHDLSFTLHAGEALGFAGLVGSGLQELPYLLTGALRAETGTISVGAISHPIRQMSSLRAKLMGIGMVPADRKREGLIPTRPISENIGLPRVRSFQLRGWLRPKREVAFAEGWIRKLAIVPAGADRESGLLSGGNQQKVVLAKWLGVSDAVLILADPTAGVDIVAKERIYEELLTQREAGLPLLVCSTDITDLVRTCSRVIALDGGRAVAEFHGPAVTEENILRHILHSSAAAGRAGS
jgi:ABC-type sugar transport system ATPase subunit